MIADIHTLAGAYVLDAVDDIERAAFDRHLAECETCRTEVDEFRETAAMLAGGTWSVPSPRMRENVLAEIKTTRQLPPQAPVPTVVAAAAAGERRRMTRRHLLSAAAAVVVAATAAGTIAYQVQDDRVRQEQATAQAVRDQESRVRGILGSPDVEVRGEQLRDGGRVTVAFSKQDNAGVILLDADAAPADGHVFQLWTVRSSTPISEGALAVGQSQVVKVVDGIASASDVGVTIEPPGGSVTPTVPMVAAVKLL
ncbi:anti-sigma factor [Actinoplanes awajinensis]|uniref:Regulator of SigK n=1 Tax=Actinoplanes awajinensis subsp. mycoplanecinus TaxID=135947 RepID=A0A101JKF7_9ACTN|nr:anti-sigma factor [Actinoplanes awajinensis]KUL28501.1 anti-sigma factor [Actinoplanes awajinensis subsp. mycoplanecinus]